MDTELKKNIIESDTLDITNSLVENEEMTSKFYNFECIILYGYIDYTVAQNATDKYIINTPLELFESPYIAKLFTPTTGNRKLMAFAVYVQDNIYDELDLILEDRVKHDKYKRTAEEIRKSVDVIRSLKSYKTDKNKKGKPYISYVVQNQNAIKQIFPL